MKNCYKTAFTLKIQTSMDQTDATATRRLSPFAFKLWSQEINATFKKYK